MRLTFSRKTMLVLSVERPKSILLLTVKHSFFIDQEMRNRVDLSLSISIRHECPSDDANGVFFGMAQTQTMFSLIRRLVFVSFLSWARLSFNREQQRRQSFLNLSAKASVNHRLSAVKRRERKSPGHHVCVCLHSSPSHQIEWYTNDDYRVQIHTSGSLSLSLSFSDSCLFDVHLSGAHEAWICRISTHGHRHDHYHCFHVSLDSKWTIRFSWFESNTDHA